MNQTPQTYPDLSACSDDAISREYHRRMLKRTSASLLHRELERRSYEQRQKPTPKKHPIPSLIRSGPPADFLQFAADFFGRTIDELRVGCRTPQLSAERHIAVSAARQVLDLTQMELADLFGFRDHTSVVYAVTRCRDSDSLSATVGQLTAAWQARQASRTPAPA